MSAPGISFITTSMDSRHHRSVGRVLFDEIIPFSGIRLHVVNTPEGVLAVTACTACGGRQELLVECPGGPRDTVAATLDVHDTLIDDWAMRHRCGQAIPPRRLRNTVDSEAARALVALDQRYAVGRRFVLVTDHKPIAVHVPVPPELAARDRDRLHAIVAHSLREQRKRQGISVVGVVVVDIERDSRRRPMDLTALAATRERALAGQARIERVPGTSRLGLGAWKWKSVVGPEHLLDGVLATAVTAGRRG